MLRILGAMALAVAVAGCGTAPASGSDGGSAAGGGGNAAGGGGASAAGGGGDASYVSLANGSLSGAVTGTITNGDVTVVAGTAASPTSVFSLSTPYSTGSLTVSSPSGAQNVTFVTAIGFIQTPGVGTYQSTDMRGGLMLAGVTASDALLFGYGALAPRGIDGTPSTPQGSWTVNLTSVTPVYVSGTGTGGGYTMYGVHGSLAATLEASEAGKAPVSLNLTF